MVLYSHVKLTQAMVLRSYYDQLLMKVESVIRNFSDWKTLNADKNVLLLLIEGCIKVYINSYI